MVDSELTVRKYMDEVIMDYINDWYITTGGNENVEELPIVPQDEWR